MVPPRVLVHLHQYREADADGTVRSGAEVGADRDAGAHFDVDGLALDE